MKRYAPADEVDFVVVGSGAAGAVVAHELSRSGFSVVVLEQGPWLTEKDFSHDPLFAALHPEKDLAPGDYGRCVGGGTVHFTGNYWRFPEIEFRQASTLGVPDGSTLADWPIQYSDLEPYYTRVEWEIGVSGLAGNPFEPPRSKPYPVGPLPIKSEGVIAKRGAAKLGWHAWPAPMAILSRPYQGRSGCVGCGVCFGAGCEVRAKSSTLVTMVPRAIATNRCEIRPNSYVRKVELNAAGRVTGVVYFDAAKREILQRAKAVVVSANGYETPRLLLLSASSLFPNGLANSSGYVGRNLMHNGSGGSRAMFPLDVKPWKGPPVSNVIWDFLSVPKDTGLYGGGGIMVRGGSAVESGWPGEPRWGKEWKSRLYAYYNRVATAEAATTCLPQQSNGVTLDPTGKDAWGLPTYTTSFRPHAQDNALARWFGERCHELVVAAGAEKALPGYGSGSGNDYHLLGTCRMGNDPRTSVVNADHRAHDVANLFIVDGSSFVTSGRGEPTMTIQALAFRAGERIAALAKSRGI